MTEHCITQPKILYYGTPVTLIATLNEDGSTNIAPISSSWALGQVLVLGIGLGGKTLENLQRHGECVLNQPDASLWQEVERLAPLTGKNPVPAYKAQNGFRFEPDKFAASGLTRLPSTSVQPCRVAECPLQIEAKVLNIRIPEYVPEFAIVEVQAVTVHADTKILRDEHHIEPKAWNPMIYNFRHYFGLGAELGKSYRSET